MSGEAGSDVWEKIMLLINCPMIGLSATVSNAEDLRSWIESVERQRAELFKSARARQVCLISHHERLADLNKYIYSNRQLHPLHPVGMMDAKHLTVRGIPQDFSLSPCETLQLCDAMKVGNADSSIAKPIPTLTDYFSPNWIIERGSCNAYSQLVRKQFETLIENKSNAAIDKIAESLRPVLPRGVQYPEHKSNTALIVEFILTLKEKNLLPCIVFCDNRNLCEEMAHSMASYLEKLETKLRETTYKAEIETLKHRVELEEQRREKFKAKRTSKAASKRKNDEESKLNAAECDRDEAESDQMLLSGHEEQLLNGMLDEGTLASRRGHDQTLVETLLNRASSENPNLVKFMHRGVAYHHSGVNNKGRVAVEALFRNRYVQVVFSTATLGKCWGTGAELFLRFLV